MIEIKDKSAVIKRVLIDFLIFALLLASDLISKDIVMNRLGLESYSSYVLIDGIFDRAHCDNARCALRHNNFECNKKT